MVIKVLKSQVRQTRVNVFVYDLAAALIVELRTHMANAMTRIKRIKKNRL